MVFENNMSYRIAEEKYSLTYQQLELLDATARLTNACMLIMDLVQNRIVCRTEKLLFIDETTQYAIQQENPNPYWSLIHEEDFAIVLEMKAAYLEFAKGFTPKQKSNHTFAINYRIRTRRRDYMVTQKFTPLKLCTNGKYWLGLFNITNSTHKTCEHAAIFGNNFRYIYDFKQKRFQPFNEHLELTLIEKAILLRAVKGFTTEQIADDLYRSVNTIKTHKSRLFDKLHVISMIEAITFIQNYNLY